MNNINNMTLSEMINEFKKRDRDVYSKEAYEFIYGDEYFGGPLNMDRFIDDVCMRYTEITGHHAINRTMAEGEALVALTNGNYLVIGY